MRGYALVFAALLILGPTVAVAAQSLTREQALAGVHRSLAPGAWP